MYLEGTRQMPRYLPGYRRCHESGFSSFGRKGSKLHFADTGILATNLLVDRMYLFPLCFAVSSNILRVEPIAALERNKRNHGANSAYASSVLPLLR